MWFLSSIIFIRSPTTRPFVVILQKHSSQVFLLRLSSELFIPGHRCCTAIMPKGQKIKKGVEVTNTVVDAAISLGSQAAALIPTHRECSIEITNTCSNYALCVPSVYVNSGFCAQPLPLTLDPSSSGNALFTKTPHAARGAVGVFTYDLHDKSTKESTEKIAVMFSVPYDFNLYSNWYAVGIFDKSTECNYDLYHKMYNNNDQTFVRKKAGQGLSYKKDSVTIVASMSDCYQPKLKVEVKDN